MTTQQTSPIDQIKKSTARERGMVRVEFYVTPEERATLRTVCKKRGYTVAGFLYMLQRKVVAQALQHESLL